MSLRAVIFTSFNLPQGSVREVEFLRLVVDGEAVGCENVRTDDPLDVVSHKRSPHYAGMLLIPVSPEHQTGKSRT